MKNLKYSLILAFATAVVASGCKKSFLESTPTEQISSEQLKAGSKQDPNLLNATVLGLYSGMYNVHTGGTTGDDDFGQKGIDIYTDMLCGDMALTRSTYGWYRTLERNTALKDYTSLPVYIPFRYYYREILGANNLIDILGGNNVIPTEDNKKYYMGQAKAMRAYAYLYLANLYSAGGYGAGTDKLLPLYTKPTDVNMPLVTSSVIYGQIEKDLLTAITLMKVVGTTGFQRDNKGQIDADVARGLLCYLYAARGTNADLQKVVSITDSVLTNYPLTTAGQTVAVVNGSGVLTNPESGFNNLSTSSWMWGADLTLSSGLDLVSWWGQMDLYTYSYAWAGDPKVIDAGLYANIRATDIRKNQFSTARSLMPINKFFDPARVIGGQRNVITDYIYMRSDEMQLLNAEAQVRLGNDALARTSLGKLMSLRFSTADYAVYSTYLATLSGTTLGGTTFPTGQSAPGVSVSLLEEIYLQERIELWGEGKAFLAMKRNKHSITKGTNHLYAEQRGATFLYNAPEETFPLPSAEVLYNPNLTK